MRILPFLFTRNDNNVHQLNRKLRAVSEAEHKSNRRNQELLNTLTKASKHASVLNDKTERLKRVRVRKHSLVYVYI